MNLRLGPELLRILGDRLLERKIKLKDFEGLSEKVLKKN